MPQRLSCWVFPGRYDCAQICTRCYPHRVDKRLGDPAFTASAEPMAPRQAILGPRGAGARCTGSAATVEAASGAMVHGTPFRQKQPRNDGSGARLGCWPIRTESVSHDLSECLASGIDEIISARHLRSTCPTLVVTGDEDYGNGPEMARAIAAEMTSAAPKYIILTGLRHMALAEEPDGMSHCPMV